MRYQEATPEFRELGAPRFCESLQIIIGTCGAKAVYGTVGTPKRLYGEWKAPYPRSVEQLTQDLGRPPTAQDVILYGLLQPANLLDIMRTFTVFERESGK